MEAAQINPEFKQILNSAQSGNLQQLYETMARQRGVNPQWLINKLIN